MSEEKRAVVDMRWLAEGREDEFKNYLGRPREDLPLADWSDDELANLCYMHGDISREQDMTQMLAAHRQGKSYTSKIAVLTAVKERMRWLSRRLAVAEGRYPGVPSALEEEVGEDQVLSEATQAMVKLIQQTSPSRGLPEWRTINDALGATAGGNVSEVQRLEAELFAARVQEVVVDLGKKGLDLHGKEGDMSVNQLLQVLHPRGEAMHLDSNIFAAPAPSPYNPVILGGGGHQSLTSLVRQLGAEHRGILPVVSARTPGDKSQIEPVMFEAGLHRLDLSAKHYLAGDHDGDQALRRKKRARKPLLTRDSYKDTNLGKLLDRSGYQHDLTRPVLAEGERWEGSPKVIGETIHHNSIREADLARFTTVCSRSGNVLHKIENKDDF